LRRTANCLCSGEGRSRQVGHRARRGANS
jgi:hypothetical protein